MTTYGITNNSNITNYTKRTAQLEGTESKPMGALPIIPEPADCYSNLPSMMQNQTSNKQSEDDVIARYSVNKLRDILKKSTYLHNELNGKDIDNMSDAEIKIFIKQKVEDLKKVDIVRKIVEKYPQYKNSIVESFIESGLYIDSFEKALTDIYSNITDESNIESKEMLGNIYIHLIANYAGLENLSDLNDDSNGVNSSIKEKLQLSGNESEGTIADKIAEYLEKCSNDPQKRQQEFLRLILSCNDISEYNESIQIFLKNHAKAVLNIDEITGNSAEALLLVLTDSSLDKMQIIGSLDVVSAGQATIDAIAESKSIQDGTMTDKAIRELCAKYNIDIDKDRAKEIIEKIQLNISYFDECTENEKEFYIKYQKEIVGGSSNILTILAASRLSEDTKKTAIGNNNKVVYDLLGESACRDVMVSVHDRIQELQTNGNDFNIDFENLARIINESTNGNYQIVVEDILRGDGVQTPLNMPETSGNGETGSYNGSHIGESSAQNPETGFFNVQPQSLLYNSQNNLAQLRQQIQDATHQNNTPQLIKPNQSIDNAIALGINLNKVVQQNIKENGVTGFVKEVLNSNIAMKCTYVRDKALNCFDSMGTGLRRLTFECIHKTSSAIVAARRMSSDELDNVQAQNIYVAQNIERIEEERKKQEDKV